jgi:predicted  nucleic acid-binding Zn-ribbon protein
VGSGKDSKKMLRYQMQALQSFRDNLGDSLRAITFAQVGYWRFAGEVRREKKRVRDLREELIGRRREREGIEREIERVRREHLRNENEFEKQRRLVEDVQSIEGAVRAGREQEKREDEAKASVVVDAGRVRERLGVLERVRDFNTFLATTAEAL